MEIQNNQQQSAQLKPLLMFKMYWEALIPKVVSTVTWHGKRAKRTVALGVGSFALMQIESEKPSAQQFGTPLHHQASGNDNL
jgi:hypothetical protein